MKYWTAKWIVKPWDRKSLSFYCPEVKDLINDDLYIWDSTFEWTCIKYFFEKPSDLVISDDIVNWLSVDYMTKDKALDYLRTNTNMKEIEPWKFIVSEEFEMMDIVYPVVYLIIE